MDPNKALYMTMLCDFYELTMGNGYLEHGMQDRITYFDVFFRSVPDDGGYAIAAGLEQIIDYIENLHFTDEDIAYLRSRKLFSEAFLDYLKNFRFTGDIWAVPEGTPVFPREPLITVRAPAIEAQLVETYLLLAVNHQSLIATKARRIVRAARGRAVMEFGSRRAQGADAAILGARAACVCMWCSCLFRVVSSDKVVYLFGRVSPQLALFLTILLRLIPRLNREAESIDLAQRVFGRGSDQGNVWERLVHCLRIFSMLITWLIQALALEADSMKSRGSALRGRTAFSIYRFDNRDRAFVIALFSGIILTGMGAILGATEMFYDPVILWKPLNGLAAASAVGYAFLCLLPLGLELWTECRFERLRRMA